MSNVNYVIEVSTPLGSPQFVSELILNFGIPACSVSFTLDRNAAIHFGTYERAKAIAQYLKMLYAASVIKIDTAEPRFLTDAALVLAS